MYLLDTMVLSELRKKARNPGLERWIAERCSGDLHLSAITVGEIERGIVLQRQKDPIFAAVLTVWLDRVVNLYASRILAPDISICRLWGRLSATLGHGGAT